MNQKQAILTIVVLLALGVVVALFVPDVLKNNPVSSQSSQTDTAQTASTTPDMALPVTHSFKNDTHTYAGVATFPNSCYSLTTSVAIEKSLPEKATIAFVVVPPAPNATCAQVITEKPFSISFKASKDAVVSATVNGSPLLLSVTEAQ